MTATASRPMPRVLIVDDDRIDVKSVRRALAGTGLPHVAVEARDGLEALELLGLESEGADAPAPCLVILDLNMPRLNGIEFLRELRSHERARSFRVLVLTTSDSLSDRNAVAAFGPVDYVTKSTPGAFDRVAGLFRRHCATGSASPTST